jgi:hypothetical protein
MSARVNDDPKTNGINEWTIMFFFASDNDLAPLIVSQLKGIKDAGYQRKAEVLVHFDPKEKGAQTRVYNVNSARKKAAEEKTDIGDSSSFIRNLLEDDIRESAPSGTLLAARAAAASDGTLASQDALTKFLAYCARHHRANHYMLFLVGHGMIVANDAFLPDQEPVSAITLEQLGETLRKFSATSGGTLELLAMHSCSMSGIEVAYQLKGTASYMMASEGLSFVGSWPYRQLMMRTFRAIEDGKAQSSDDIGILIEKLYGLSYYNARDFWVSGYSLDLGLCSLDPQKFDGLTESLQQLVVSLKEGLDDGRGKELILLAHLESQSYWGESYTDIYDFCRCLSAKCEADGVQGKIKTACEVVMQKLDPVDSPEALERLKALVIHSRHFGSKYQYSHGLSVYFPWAEPIEEKDLLSKYNEYAFTKAFGGDTSWLSFLKMYFDKTKRAREDGGPADKARANEDPILDVSQKAATAAAAAGIGVGATVAHGFGALSEGGTDKVSGSTGAACSCPTIKNYPIDKV